MKIKLLFFIGCLLFAFASCDSDRPVYNPKPRAYPKIEFPERGYIKVDPKTCPFSFERASYAEFVQDSLFFGEETENDCWFDLYVPSLKGTIHCSYYAIDKENTLDKLITDAHTLSNKHGIKAEFMDDIKVSKPGKVYGNVMNIEGDVATPFQFYLTDSTSHFLRGSLYVKAQINTDSLGPVFDFLKVDAMHIINTFEWE
jgi:gliding motility-associated lipoprotein GldD